MLHSTFAVAPSRYHLNARAYRRTAKEVVLAAHHYLSFILTGKASIHAVPTRWCHRVVQSFKTGARRQAIL